MRTRRSSKTSAPVGAPPPDAAAASAPVSAPPRAGEVAVSARLIVIEEGLYSLHLGALRREPGTTAGMGLPALYVSAPPSNDYDPVDIPATSGELPNWFGPEGGVVVVRSPPGGGVVLVTAYGTPEATAALTIDIRRLDRPQPAPPPGDRGRTEPAAAPSVAVPVERAIASEIILHIEREGDRRFPAQGWVGNRGRRLRVEAFAIRPLEGLSASDIEYKAFGPNGRETPWVSDAKLCGTRGRGLPLTGFAVRIVPRLRDRFEVVYEGSFFNSGAVGPHRDGEPCMPAVFDDPLEAINVRVIERAAR